MSAIAIATSPNTDWRTRCCRSIPSFWRWWRRQNRAPRRDAFSTRPAAAAAIWRSSAATIPTSGAGTPGVRVANVIDHAPYHGVQLHPRDCRAAFIEFKHTEGSDDVLGPYPPAGPDWQKSIRKDVTQALVGVEMESPEPEDLARHWGQIIG